MLDRSSRNKFFIFVLALELFLASCSKEEKKYYNVDIMCPNRAIVTIRYSDLEEVRIAILRADFEKKYESTSIGYTAIKLPDGRSLRVEKIPPEEMIKCPLRQTEIKRISKAYLDSI